jgi:hypothetical protein
MKWLKAIGAALLAGFLAGGAQQAAGLSKSLPETRTAGNAGTGAYQLKAQLPPTIRKGEPTTLILNVWRKGKPADNVMACLSPVPIFPSTEDAMDTTPAGGMDLGASPDSAAQPACTTALAGVPGGPGTYLFMWEPDTAGRVNLTFTAGDSALTVGTDVGSAPPKAAILALFVLFVVTVLSCAAYLRCRPRPEGAVS